jgi:hypothetical protein
LNRGVLVREALEQRLVVAGHEADVVAVGGGQCGMGLKCVVRNARTAFALAPSMMGT